MKEQIRNFIAETTFTDPSIINDDTLIFEEGIFDSMGLLGLINFFESEFNVTVEDTELQEENFASINNMVSFLERKRSVAA